jgi:hypothetical protein
VRDCSLHGDQNFAGEILTFFSLQAMFKPSTQTTQLLDSDQSPDFVYQLGSHLKSEFGSLEFPKLQENFDWCNCRLHRVAVTRILNEINFGAYWGAKIHGVGKILIWFGRGFPHICESAIVQVISSGDCLETQIIIDQKWMAKTNHLWTV